MLLSIFRQSKHKLKNLWKDVNFKFFALRNPTTAQIIRKVIEKHLSYLSQEALCDLAQAAIHNERKGITGVIIEAGCALGGSAITLASAKSSCRSLFLYDVFGMIPSPSIRDGQDVHNRYQKIITGRAEGLGSQLYYGYEENLYGKVVQSFVDFGLDIKGNNIKLVQGLYEDTLKVEVPVALAHIDCDWYDSVLTCLQQIEPHLVSGGTLVIDDYDHWSGCKRAVDEYFVDKKFAYYFIKKNRLHIVKK
ncbi:MAG: TylF/MycF family methyltransferase [Anaerolineae bacterium]|nr:TylF/MycF family methyltransferase [Anaerolineae bacterium]